MEFISDKNKLDYYIKKYRLKDYFSDEYFPEHYKYMTVTKFARDEYIFTERGNIQYMYIFLNGKVKVCSLLRNGKQQLLNLITGISFFGDLELFNITNPFITIQAVNESYAIALPLTFTQELLFQDSVFLKHIGTLLAKKIYVFTSNAALNMNYPLENRLCSYLSFISKKINIEGTEYSYFNENLSETAELLGTSYRHLQRTLKDLKESNILEKYEKGYIVKDSKALSKLASDEYLI
ncbi:Regulatory protein YeiL [uncultured Roseburia sp.]|uniref:Cyclic nucleotide-binding domain-containing protein n=1 Tax=Brotonthovivens ammoniilytica TaxID=2981725 RepID=A0ABT2TJA6_9FIRM|nr:cyclic nucleotide-binding domain-containing protein [Brotonthovivens ammoniilytica]MCU6761717.1 cyclic nucleotide-binding domain-containing protein [Brotonthovivens ammoniilytica]SCI44402.1 Regulatory protein YeiL [uncultured Roseburia sp.]